MRLAYIFILAALAALSYLPSHSDAWAAEPSASKAAPEPAGQSSADEPETAKPPSILLYPQSTADITLHGTCRTVKNTSRDVLAFLPVSSADAWAHFDSRQPPIEVKPCAQ